jgi:glycosyltransferase involved in cell wall biosynthesis
MPEMSAVVPFYNAERYIRGCVTGLLAQNYPEDAYEIIMVDNNSTDGSADIVRQYPRIKLLAEPKQGAYAARNRGLLAARGAVIAFTDPDCVPDKDWLSSIAATISPADVRIVLGHSRMASDSLCLSLLAAYEHQKAHFVFNSPTKELYYAYTNNMAVRRDVFSKLGPFVERARGADVLFVRRVVDEFSCGVVRYDPTVRVRHMEIDSPWTYYQKQAIYGRSLRLCGEIVPSRPLMARQRLQVFARVVRSGQCSWRRAPLLFFLLSVGGACFSAGRWTAAWTLWRKATSAPAPGDGMFPSGDDRGPRTPPC